MVNPRALPVLLQPGAVLAAVNNAARRAKGAVAKRPLLTAAARDALGSSGRDEETASFSRTKKHEQMRSEAAPSKGGTFLPTQDGEEAIL